MRTDIAFSKLPTPIDQAVEFQMRRGNTPEDLFSEFQQLLSRLFPGLKLRFSIQGFFIPCFVALSLDARGLGFFFV